MAYWPEILKIIEGGCKLNSEKVFNYSQMLADKLRLDGNIKVADRILQTLAQSNMAHTVRDSAARAESRLPFDQDSRFPVADIFPPESLESEVILSEEVEQLVRQFISYYKNSAKLVEAGLELPHTLLLYGPPGCGKTAAAKSLAHELGLPLVMARLDSMVSSYLGSTAKNIRMLFDYAKDHPCVLLLDEFDAIAKLRDDNHELGELKRVVNSLLQNIDSLGTESVLIAATNHEHMLDPAVWRRFTFSAKLDVPDDQIRKKLAALFLRGTVSDSNTLKVLDELFRGLSGANIKTICTQALRAAVLDGRQIPKLGDFAVPFFSCVSLPHILPVNIEQVMFLRKRNAKLFSFALIGEILGFTRQWTQQLYQKGVALCDREATSTHKAGVTAKRGQADPETTNT